MYINQYEITYGICDNNIRNDLMNYVVNKEQETQNDVGENESAIVLI